MIINELLSLTEHHARLDKMRLPFNRSRLKDALNAVLNLCNPRAHKNEIDEMYIQGWNAAMNKVSKAIERELK